MGSDVLHSIDTPSDQGDEVSSWIRVHIPLNEYQVANLHWLLTKAKDDNDLHTGDWLCEIQQMLEKAARSAGISHYPANSPLIGHSPSL